VSRVYRPLLRGWAALDLPDPLSGPGSSLSDEEEDEPDEDRSGPVAADFATAALFVLFRTDPSCGPAAGIAAPPPASDSCEDEDEDEDCEDEEAGGTRLTVGGFLTVGFGPLVFLVPVVRPTDRSPSCAAPGARAGGRGREDVSAKELPGRRRSG